VISKVKADDNVKRYLRGKLIPSSTRRYFLMRVVVEDFD